MGSAWEGNHKGCPYEIHSLSQGVGGGTKRLPSSFASPVWGRRDVVGAIHELPLRISPNKTTTSAAFPALVFPVSSVIHRLKIGGHVVCAGRPERAEKG